MVCTLLIQFICMDEREKLWEEELEQGWEVLVLFVVIYVSTQGHTEIVKYCA